jgi:hypothetical protein
LPYGKTDFIFDPNNTDMMTAVGVGVDAGGVLCVLSDASVLSVECQLQFYCVSYHNIANLSAPPVVPVVVSYDAIMS